MMRSFFKHLSGLISCLPLFWQPSMMLPPPCFTLMMPLPDTGLQNSPQTPFFFSIRPEKRFRSQSPLKAICQAPSRPPSVVRVVTSRSSIMKAWLMKCCRELLKLPKVTANSVSSLHNHRGHNAATQSFHTFTAAQCRTTVLSWMYVVWIVGALNTGVCLSKLCFMEVDSSQVLVASWG